MSKLIDAYPPEYDGQEYVMVKLFSSQFDRRENGHQQIHVDECLRVSKWDLVEAGHENKTEFKMSADEARQFKKDMNAVVTDAIDENGKRVASSVSNFENIGPDGVTRLQTAQETIYAKNSKPHSVAMENGERLFAITRQRNWEGSTVTVINANEGKFESFKDTNNNAAPAKIVFNQDGTPSFGEFFDDNNKSEITVEANEMDPNLKKMVKHTVNFGQIDEMQQAQQSLQNRQQMKM